MHGKNRTNPRGTEIDELPFKRIRRWKNDNRGSLRFFSFFGSSREGMLGADGIRLTRPCTKPMAGLPACAAPHATIRKL